MISSTKSYPTTGPSEAERQAAALMSSSAKEADWQRTSDSRQILETADAICCLIFDQDYPADYHPDTDIKIGTGTGFLIAPRLLMTCRHVLPHQKAAQHARARFFYDGRRQPLELALNPDETKGGFFLTSSLGRKIDQNNDLDFTIVALKEPTHATRYLSIFQCCILKDHLKDNKLNVYVIQHPGGTKDPRTTEEAYQREAKGVIKACEQRVVRYQVKTAGGTSGAPVLNEDGQLVAIHEGGYSQGSPLLPYGVRMDKIISHLGEEGKKKIETYVEYYGTEEALCERALKDFYRSRNTISIFSPGKKQGKWTLEFPFPGIYKNLALLAIPPDNSSGEKKVNEPLIVEQLFTHEALQNPLKRRVLLIGAAGIGKSTLCHYITYQWALGKLWPEYRAVIWVRLREIKLGETWQSFLIRKCPHLSHSLLNKQSFRDHTLLLLDGYDEMPTHPDAGEVFYELTKEGRFPHLFLTSRPQLVEFEPMCQFEISGFDASNTDLYVTDFFRQVSQEPQKWPSTKIKAFREGLKSHPLAWDLARVPLNLSLFCVLAVEGDNLFDAHAVTLTSIYLKTINWMYKWYLLRLKQNGREELSESAIRQMRYPRYEHKKVKKLASLLEKMAWDNINTAEEPGFYETAKVNEMLVDEDFTSDDLNYLGLFRLENERSWFIHFTFQEFFAAAYLAHLYTTDRPQAQQWMTHHKFHPRYQLVLQMAAGYLFARDEKCAQLFFDDLYQEPRDLAKGYELGLLARCFEECQQPQKITHYTDFIEQAYSFLDCHINRGLVLNYHSTSKSHSTLLQHHPQLLDKIIEKMAENYENEPKIIQSLSLLIQLIRDKQVLPLKVILMIVGYLKDERDYIKRTAVRAMGALTQAGQLVPEIVWKSLLECVQDSEVGGFIKITVLESLRSLAQKERKVSEETWKAFIHHVQDSRGVIKQMMLSIIRILAETQECVPEIVWQSIRARIQDPQIMEAAKGTIVETLARLINSKQQVPDDILPLLITCIQNPQTGEVLKSLVLELLGIWDQGGKEIPERIWQVMMIDAQNPQTSEGIRQLAVMALGNFSRRREGIPSFVWQALIHFVENDQTIDSVEKFTAILQSFAQTKQRVPDDVWQCMLDILQNPQREEEIKRALISLLGKLAHIGQKIPDSMVHTIEVADEQNSQIIVNVKRTTKEDWGPLTEKEPTIPDFVWRSLVEYVQDPQAVDEVKPVIVEALEELARTRQKIPDFVWQSLVESMQASHISNDDPFWMTAVLKGFAQNGQIIPNLIWQSLRLEFVGELAWWTRQIVPEFVWRLLRDGIQDLHTTTGIKRSMVRALKNLAKTNQEIPDFVWQKPVAYLQNVEASVESKRWAAQTLGSLVHTEKKVPDYVWELLLAYVKDASEKSKQWAARNLESPIQTSENNLENIEELFFGRMKDSQVSRSLEDLLMQALEKLVKMQETAPEIVWKSLIFYIQDPQTSEHLKKWSAQTLENLSKKGQLFPEFVGESLITCLQDSQAESTVQQSISRILGKLIQMKQAAPDFVWQSLIVYIQSSHSESLKNLAVLDLRSIVQGSHQPVSDFVWMLLIDYVQNYQLRRVAAFQALGQLGQKGEIAPDEVWRLLSEYMRDPHLSESVTHVLVTFAQAGQKIPDYVWKALVMDIKDLEIESAEVRVSIIGALEKLTQVEQIVPNDVATALIAYIQNPQIQEATKRLAIQALGNLAQAGALNVEEMSKILTESPILYPEKLSCLMKMVEKNGKLSIATLKSLVQHAYTCQQFDNNIGAICRIFSTLRFQHYENELTSDLLIRICSLVGYVCFMVEGKFCVFGKDNKMVKLSCANKDCS